MYKVELINGNIRSVTPYEVKRYKNIINAFLLLNADELNQLKGNEGYKEQNEEQPYIFSEYPNDFKKIEIEISR